MRVAVCAGLGLAWPAGPAPGFSGLRIPGGAPTLVRIEGTLARESPDKGWWLSIGNAGEVRYITHYTMKVLNKSFLSMTVVDQLTPNNPNMFLGPQSRHYWHAIADPALLGRRMVLEAYVADSRGQLWVTKFEPLPASSDQPG
jgi:hypothetical protein